MKYQIREMKVADIPAVIEGEKDFKKHWDTICFIQN